MLAKDTLMTSIYIFTMLRVHMTKIAQIPKYKGYRRISSVQSWPYSNVPDGSARERDRGVTSKREGQTLWFCKMVDDRK